MAAPTRTFAASRWAFAVFFGLPLLPLCGFVLNGSPEVVFFLGAASFLIGVLLAVVLAACLSVPKADSPPVAPRFHFTIRDLLCLTIFVLGMTVFMAAGFRCEAAERASRPDPLPTVAFRQFVWQMESGLVCLTLAGSLWIRSALNRPCLRYQKTTRQKDE
jgi:hypothetical protein